MIESPPPTPERAGVATDVEIVGSLWRVPAIRQLGVVTVLGFTSFFLTLSSLPTWAVLGGTDKAAAGVVTAAMLGCTVIVQTIVPVLERRLGIVRLLGLGLIALAVPAPLYLISHQLWWLSSLSAVRGFGFGVLTVIGAVLTARVAPITRHGEVVGIYGLSIAVPNLVAVPVSTALTLSQHFAWVAGLAAVPVLALPFVARLAPAVAVPAAQSEVRVSAAAERPGGTIVAMRAVAVPSMVLFVVTLAGGGVLTFLPIERPTGAVATLSLLLFGLTSALSRWRVGRLLSRVDGRVLLGAGLAVGVLGLVAVAAVLSHDGPGALAVLLVGSAVFGIGYGMTQNVSQVVAFERAGPEHTVVASAVWNAAFDAGTAVGAYAVGALAASGLGLSWTYAVCAGLIATVIPFAAATGARSRAD